MLLPFVWMVSTSLKTESEIISANMSFFPNGFHIANYRRAFEIIPIFSYMGNTVFIAVLKIFGEVFISAAVAFGFARFKFKGRNVLFMILLATMMLPYEVTMILRSLFGQNLVLTDG